MGDFISDPDSELPADTAGQKADRRPVPPGQASTHVSAGNFNEHTTRINAAHEALRDVREALLPAKGARPPNRPFVLLKRLPAEGGYAIPVDPSADVFVNTIIDLAEFGLIQSQWLNQIDVICEKRVDGQWVPMVPDYNAPDYPPGSPAQEYGIPGVFQSVVPLMDVVFNYDTGLPEGAVLDYSQLDGNGLSSRNNYAIGFNDQHVRCRFVRFMLKRDPGYVYSPEEVAMLADRRVHLNLLGPQNKVVLGTYAIPQAQGAMVCDLKVDVADFGAGGAEETARLMVEFLRDGKIIHTSLGNAGNMPWPAYLDEVFDPPALPLQASVGPYHKTPIGDDYQFMGIDGDGVALSERYSGGDYFGSDGLDGDVVLGALGNCLANVSTQVRLRLWRAASDGPTEYVPTRGAAAIPIPPGTQAADQVRVSVLIAGKNQAGLYPFLPQTANPDPWTMRQDIRDHGTALNDAGNRLVALEGKATRTVDALPAADASLDGILHRLHVDGQADTISVVGQKADGTWAWVLLGTAPV